MAKMKVWNDNRFTHSEMFKGDMITIKPGKYVIMEDDDAVMFRGQYYPMKRAGDDTPSEEFMKKIRIEHHDDGYDDIEEVESFRCLACNYIGESQDEVDAHAKVNHADQLTVDPEAEKEMKRGRGRPRAS